MTQLHLDLHGATNYLNTPWSFGVNVSGLPAVLNKTIQRHLLMGRDELGFRNVRFGGIFNDAIGILQPGGSYDFTAVEKALDWLMEQGLSPFVVLNGVPSALAAENSNLPGDREKWVDMARALAAFVDGRYGCDAQEWHFEVWPGADKQAQFSGSREDYYDLYNRTARAIKSVNPQLKVGGASATDTEWTTAFIDHLAQPSETFGLEMQRCDFITVSGLTDGIADVQSVVDRLSPVRIKLTEALGESTPLMLSAWSRDGQAPSIEHDRVAAGGYAAALASATVDLVGGALHESMSDADQPEPVRYEPFHGGRGLVTVNDIRKASFNAMKLLQEHVGYKMNWHWHEPTEGVTIFVTKDYHNLIRILATYDKPGATGPAKFTIEGLPETVKWGQVQVLRPTAGSPLEAWTESGKPMFVNRNLLDDLDHASLPAMAEVNFHDFPPRLEPGMTLQLTIPLPDDVMMMD